MKQSLIVLLTLLVLIASLPAALSSRGESLTLTHADSQEIVDLLETLVPTASFRVVNERTFFAEGTEEELDCVRELTEELDQVLFARTTGFLVRLTPDGEKALGLDSDLGVQRLFFSECFGPVFSGTVKFLETQELAEILEEQTGESAILFRTSDLAVKRSKDSLEIVHQAESCQVDITEEGSHWTAYRVPRADIDRGRTWLLVESYYEDKTL